VSSSSLRADVDRYAGHHAMSFELARLTTVAALLGWLEAQERREERERLAAREEEPDFDQPPVTRLRTDEEIGERLQKRGAAKR
jgi:hypothetical protein